MIPPSIQSRVSWAHDNQDHFFGNDMKIANEEVFAKILGSAL